MHPRLYMQTVQFVSYKRSSDSITFETRRASGRRYHFVMTRNQFLAFDDVIHLTEKSNSYGHYPLGQAMWMYYNAYVVKLYKETPNCGRIKFQFERFSEYKRYTHARLRSLIRFRGDGARRRRQRGESSVASYQRPLSVTMQSSNQPSTSKRNCWIKREASPRSANNANLPHDDEACSVLSERHYTNPRRRSDSISSNTSTFTNISSVTSVRLDASDEAMESE